MTSKTGILDSELVRRFRDAVAELEATYRESRLDDDSVEAELREWLDGTDEPLPWTRPDRVTADEWFFTTTLYGTMTLAGQRTHIRRFYRSLFEEAAHRDIRNFVPGMKEFEGLRSRWMVRRLCRMGEVLRDRNLSMSEYTEQLRRLQAIATDENRTPALDAIANDLRTDSWKTLSVFIRDCVGGDAFPIDSRVRRELTRRGLPDDERQLVRLALHVGRNPRQIARLFYQAGGR
jgi:hypothetical protein